MGKILRYIRYWFFVGTNWNFTLAFFTIFHEIRGEKKYRVNTIELDRLKNTSVKGNNILHASIYQACNYYVLERGFNYLSHAITDRNNFTDFGCGKGRTLAVAAYYGFKNITGIDFAAALCQVAEKNMGDIKGLYPGTNFNIICEDVVDYKVLSEQTVFFFFNPFDQVIMLAVLKNILASLKENERKVYVMYANPLFKEIFLSAGFIEEYHFKKLTYQEMSILTNEVSKTNCDE